MKKLRVIVFLIIVFLIVTNPSVKDYKEYTGSEIVKRKYNFILFSLYDKGDKDGDYLSNYYDLGIASNFFQYGK